MDVHKLARIAATTMLLFPIVSGSEAADNLASHMPVAERYRRVLRLPHLAHLLALATLVRLPIAMEAIAIVLFVHEQTDSFATTGVVAATFGVANGVCTPIEARLVDRFGPKRILRPLAFGHAIALTALVAAGLAGLPGIALAGLGLLAGGSYPPTNSVVRQLIGSFTATQRGLVPAAFALDSIGAESMFISGPLLTGVFVAFASSAAALIFAAIINIVCVLLLVTSPMAKAWRAPPPAESHWLGALRSRGLRTMVAYGLPMGMVFGSIPVSMVAFAESKGSPASAAWLVSLLSVGGAIGAFTYGANAHRFRARTTAVGLACTIPMSLAPLVFASSLAYMAVLVVIAGLMTTPLMAVTNHMISEVVLPGTEAESFTWPFTAMLLGLALGAAIAGAMIESNGWRAGILTAVGSGLCITILTIARRRTLPDTLLSVIAEPATA